MTRPPHHRIDRHSLKGMAAMLITLALSFPAGAAISNGPINTNAAAAEQQRALQFYYAEQSFQQQLKVGRERYNQKQVNRAKVIAAMSSELRARQQTVGFQPMTSPDDTTGHLTGWFRPSLVMAALAVYFIGFGYRLYRLHAENGFGRRRQPMWDPAPPVVARPMVDEIFFCKGSGADGRGRFSKEGIVVLKGSIGHNENGPSIEGKSAEPLRVKLLDSGVVREEGDTVIFEEDHLFPTPSLAAMALMGRTVNGWLEWKTADGISLDTAQRLKPFEFAPELCARERVRRPGIPTMIKNFFKWFKVNRFAGVFQRQGAKTQQRKEDLSHAGPGPQMPTRQSPGID